MSESRVREGVDEGVSDGAHRAIDGNERPLSGVRDDKIHRILCE